MNFFEIFIGIFSKPKQTLDNLVSESGITSSFQYYLIVTLIGSLLQAWVFYINPNSYPFLSGQVTMLFSVFFFVLFFIFEVVAIFISAGIFHLFVKLFKGQKPFYQTFKSVA